MNATEQIKQLHADYVIPTYAPDLLLVKGRGTKVWDAAGNAYLDFLAGIAVANIGHGHPRLLKAIRQQSRKLMHVSNLFYNELQPKLAEALSQWSLGGKCFFCNSGAEANEALIKLARLWGQDQGRYEIITMRNSFHGRTLATLTATGQDKVKKGFAPLPEGFVYANFNDLDSVRKAISDKTAAVLVEAVQGEGGVRPGRADFIKNLEALCRQKNVLLFFDEVQCGMGRTGHWFGYQRYGVTPDAIALAKGLGGGFPIGAIATAPAVADVLHAGSHATTFGGTPLACAAALAVIQTIDAEGLLGNATRMGDLFMEKLKQVAAKYAFIREVRGAGLMIGLVLNQPAKPLEIWLRKHGVLALATAETVLRFLPPLTVRATDIRKAAKAVDQACADWVAESERPGPDDDLSRFKHLRLNTD